MNNGISNGVNNEGTGSGRVRRGNRTWLRWVPAAAVPAVIAAGVLAGSIPARAGDPLPVKSPADVIALMGGHKAHSFSGTVEQTSDLGLPDLPAAGPSSAPRPVDGPASVMELLTADHTARVFVDGKAKARIQVVDRMAERDIIRRDNDVWFYSSRDNSAAHLTLPHFASDLPLPAPEFTEPEPPAIPAPHTPQELAERFLAAVGPSTEVSVGPDVEVAGRAAYNLLLEPRTAGTLVGNVAIAVDGITGMPLSVKVTARGAAQPAFSAGFTSLSLDVPPGELFTFIPPPGSTVEELPFQPHHSRSLRPQLPGGPEMPVVPDRMPGNVQDGDRPQVSGSGWEAVVEIPAAAAGKSAGSFLSGNPLLDQAAVVVPGGRILSTALFSVMLADDGRVFAGMVPPDRLQATLEAP